MLILSPMEGFILFDKPKGWTSFKAVSYVRGAIARATNARPKSIKVGHSGTLDPFATGLLILLVGKNYTRRAGELLKQSKIYEVVMELDSSSTTGDPEGSLTVEPTPLKPPSLSELSTAMTSLTGDIMQTPPAFSAIKVNGVRAYKLARENKPVIIAPRMITVHHIELLNYDYPEVTFMAHVSSGTYIRTLVEDIARLMERSAYTKELRRVSIGKYSIDTAINFEAINEQTIESQLRREL